VGSCSVREGCNGIWSVQSDGVNVLFVFVEEGELLSVVGGEIMLVLLITVGGKYVSVCVFGFTLG
jgi:hypothetical protein